MELVYSDLISNDINSFEDITYNNDDGMNYKEDSKFDKKKESPPVIIYYNKKNREEEEEDVEENEDVKQLRQFIYTTVIVILFFVCIILFISRLKCRKSQSSSILPWESSNNPMPGEEDASQKSQITKKSDLPPNVEEDASSSGLASY